MVLEKSFVAQFSAADESPGIKDCISRARTKLKQVLKNSVLQINKILMQYF